LWLARVANYGVLVDIVAPLGDFLEEVNGGNIYIPVLVDGTQSYTQVKTVELVAYEEAQCIMVDSADHLYVTDDNIVTHNSSIAETLKNLMEVHPIYVLTAEDGTQSPVFESPLGLFVGEEKAIEELYSISPRYIPKTMSPWAAKRLNEYGGDISKFKVIKLYPNKLNQIAIAKTEPLDDNNADISSLIGKVDLRKLQDYSAHDADCYAYNGGLCRGNRGLVEMVEIFKSNIKTLNPLLEATQAKSFAALEPIGNIPFEGVILSHCNATEWMSFRNDRKNEAFLDRVYVVKIPYCLRYEEERQIYQKMLNGSSLHDAPCVPETLDILAKFSVLTRLEEHKNSNLYSKMRVYNGENIKQEDNHSKPLQEYKDSASQEEGMSGSSTRWAFKLLAKVFNFDTSSGEISADPVTLFVVLELEISVQQ
jgi:serine protein kinase